MLARDTAPWTWRARLVRTPNGRKTMRFSSRMRRTAAVAVAGAVALTTALTGCSSQSGSSGGGGSATAGTINWWSWTPDNDVAEREIADFNKQYPKIKVIYKKVPIDNYAAVLRPALASNDGPDVFTVNASGAFSGKTFAPYAYDLTADVKKKLGADWKSKVYAGGTQAFTIKGRLVAQEFAQVGAGIMWINQDLFDKYKLKAPTNYAEWKKVCATFRSNGLGCFREGMQGTAGFPIDTLSSIVNYDTPGAWTQLLQGKRKWTDPVVVRGLQTLQDLTKDKILDSGAVGFMQYPEVNNSFLSGKVPMVQMGTWYQQYTTVNSLKAALAGAGVSDTDAKTNIVPINFPDTAGKGNPFVMTSDPDAGQAVNAKSKARSAAVTFALWLGADAKGQQVVANNLDSYPTLKSVAPQFENIELVNKDVQLPLLKNVQDVLLKADAPRLNGLGAQTSDALVNACQQVTSGKSPASVVEAVEQGAEADRQGQ